jgi:hypothetical protein
LNWKFAALIGLPVGAVTGQGAAIAQYLRAHRGYAPASEHAAARANPGKRDIFTGRMVDLSILHA